MRLGARLMLIVSLVAVLPLAIASATALGMHRQALEDSLYDLHGHVAESGALFVETYLRELRVRVEQTAGAVGWGELTEEERLGAVWLVYGQDPDFVATVLLDGPSWVASPAHVADPSVVEGDLAEHPTLGRDGAESVRAAVASGLAPQGGFGVISGVSSRTDEPLLLTAMQVPGAEGRPWTLGVVASVRSLCARLQSLATRGTELLLTGVDGAVVCPSGTDEQRIELPAAPELRRSGISYYEAQRATGRVLMSVKSLPGSWQVVARQPRERAFAASEAMLLQAALWTALAALVALLVGSLLARRITRPVNELVQGAQQIADGNLDYRLAQGGSDELGDLSRGFNQMAAELGRRDAEIRDWNKKLESKIEERTRELEEIQEQLTHSQKISAVTNLGAGIAHEINNPLTGVIGLTQVLLAKARKREGAEREAELLGEVEREALRIKGIVSTLLSFSQNYGGEGFRPLEANTVVRGALDIVEPQVLRDGIVLIPEFQDDLPGILGNKTQLQQMLLYLLDNSRIAMQQGGEIRVTTSAEANRVVRICVQDQGKGIAPEHLDRIFEPFFTTKDNWRGEGLGLTAAFRIAEEHHGTIKAESVVGVGTTMTITLPANRTATQLV